MSDTFMPTLPLIPIPRSARKGTGHFIKSLNTQTNRSKERPCPQEGRGPAQRPCFAGADESQSRVCCCRTAVTSPRLTPPVRSTEHLSENLCGTRTARGGGVVGSRG